MTGQLALAVTDIDLSRFVTFRPREGFQHKHWRVLGEPSAGAKGYARFNGRSGVMLGVVALIRGGGDAVVLQFDDGTVESFLPSILAPDLTEEPRG